MPHRFKVEFGVNQSARTKLTRFNIQDEVELRQKISNEFGFSPKQE